MRSPTRRTLVLSLCLTMVAACGGATGPSPSPPAAPVAATPAGPTGTPVPTPGPASPSAAATPAIISEGKLAGGTYRLLPFGSVPSLSIDAVVPAGWQGVPGWAILGPGGTSGPDGIGMAFLKVDGVFSDPCRWDVAGTGKWPQAGDVAAGPGVDDLVDALVANKAYAPTKPTAVTLAGYRGKQLDLRLPSDVDFSTCDRETGDASGHFYVFGGYDGGLYAQGPGNRWHLSVVDVGGTRLVVVLGDYAGTPEADRAAAQAIIDSLVITP